MLFSDIAALVLAFVFGGVAAWASNYLAQNSFQPILGLNTSTQFILFSGLGSLALLWLDMRGHYRQRLPFWETVGNIVTVAFVGFLVCGFVQFAAKGDFSRLWLGFSWVFFGSLILILRGAMRIWLDTRGRWQVSAIFIGEGPSAEAAMNALKREPHMGFTIVRQLPSNTMNQLTQPDAWKQLLMKHDANYIFLALEGSELEHQHQALKALVRERLPCSVIPPWMDLPTGALSPHHFLMHDVLMLHDTNRLCLPLPRFLKRCFDIAISGTALLLLSPLFLALTLIVRTDGGPAFFSQKRVGINGRLFRCYKFRSMRQDAEIYLQHYLLSHPEAAEEWRQYQKLKNDVRITKVGHFIRRTSIDELPQLFNVLMGDMSLVGPRPIMQGQEEFYADDFVYYESVRPGITGPWQVSGRNTLTFKERVRLEICYARNWSLWLDIVILLKTVPALLKSDNAF